MNNPLVSPSLGGSGNANIEDIATRLNNLEIMLQPFSEVNISAADPYNPSIDQSMVVLARQANNKAALPAECPLGSISDGKMTPGWVMGPNKSELLEPVYSSSNYRSRKVWVKAEWEANEIDGVLQAGGNMGKVTVHSGSSLPKDSVPSLNSLKGTAYYPLGFWDKHGAWQRSGCGIITINFCPGGFIKSRP